MATKTILKLKWDTLDIQAREQILSNACLQSRLAHYEWVEI
jgi:hypothetical protein